MTALHETFAGSTSSGRTCERHEDGVRCDVSPCQSREVPAWLAGGKPRRADLCAAHQAELDAILTGRRKPSDPPVPKTEPKMPQPDEIAPGSHAEQALIRVRERPDSTTREIADILDVSVSSAHTALRRLHKLGLIKPRGAWPERWSAITSQETPCTKPESPATPTTTATPATTAGTTNETTVSTSTTSDAATAPGCAEPATDTPSTCTPTDATPPATTTGAGPAPTASADAVEPAPEAPPPSDAPPSEPASSDSGEPTPVADASPSGAASCSTTSPGDLHGVEVWVSEHAEPDTLTAVTLDEIAAMKVAEAFERDFPEPTPAAEAPTAPSEPDEGAASPAGPGEAVRPGAPEALHHEVRAALLPLREALGCGPAESVADMVAQARALRAAEVESGGLRAEVARLTETCALHEADKRALWAAVQGACDALRVTEDDTDDWPKLPAAAARAARDRDEALAEVARLRKAPDARAADHAADVALRRARATVDDLRAEVAAYAESRRRVLHALRDADVPEWEADDGDERGVAALVRQRDALRDEVVRASVGFRLIAEAAEASDIAEAASMSGGWTGNHIDDLRADVAKLVERPARVEKQWDISRGEAYAANAHLDRIAKALGVPDDWRDLADDVLETTAAGWREQAKRHEDAATVARGEVAVLREALARLTEQAEAVGDVARVLRCEPGDVAGAALALLEQAALARGEVAGLERALRVVAEVRRG